MNKYEIGKKLKQLRISRNISQEEIANHLNSTPQKISSFETGRTRIPLDQFVELCSFYGITPDEFFSFSKKPVSKEVSEILEMFSQLDEAGKKKVLDYVVDILSTGRYSDDK